MSEENKNNPVAKSRWPVWLLAAAFLLFVFFVAGFLALLTKLPENVVARGVTIGQIDLGGLSQEQAERIVARQTENLETQGLNFVYKNVAVNLPAVKHSVTNPEISSVIFDYDAAKTVERALSLGRTGNSLNQIITRLYLRLFGLKTDPVYSLSLEEAIKFLRGNLSTYETEIKNAALKVDNSSVLKVSIVEEASGKSFDYVLAGEELKKKLDNLDSSDVLLRLNNVEPDVSKKEAEQMMPILSEALSQGPIIFQSGEKEFKVEPKEWGKWVVIRETGRKNILALDESAFKSYLQEKIDGEIESEFEEAKFVMEGGKVKEFKAGQAGQKINVEVILKAAEKAIFEGGERKIQLVMETVQPELTLEKVNTFGIKELLGVGKTNFKGSPLNRRKNIARGAAIFNGILIAPGEIFSTINRLKPIDDTNGFFPELVIKGNKTTPEFGGGLCQVSTTLFRAVLASGLPVLERTAHAYRVSYYEPPVGMDATIYDPAPDFKFLNDTGNYILVQARVEGDNLIFEFWGTKDGRSVKMSDPKIFNIKSPPAPKLIETLDLPVGQKKCTEKAHAGADAVFDYIVSYADGTVKSQEFRSRYRPWGEVCMIGVEKLSEPAPVDGLLTPTSTPAAVNSGGASVPAAPITP